MPHDCRSTALAMVLGLAASAAGVARADIIFSLGPAAFTDGPREDGAGTLAQKDTNLRNNADGFSYVDSRLRYSFSLPDDLNEQITISWEILRFFSVREACEAFTIASLSGTIAAGSLDPFGTVDEIAQVTDVVELANISRATPIVRGPLGAGQFEFSDGPVTSNTFAIGPGAYTLRQRGRIVFTPTDPRGITVEFSIKEFRSGIQCVAVPEPASLALVALGGAASWGLLGRRRRHRTSS